MLDRRSFIRNATMSVLALPLAAKAQTLVDRGLFDEADVPFIRDHLLNLVNLTRLRAGINDLQLDELAGEVATRHAIDMATGRFISHWGSDGRKPFYRYAMAGGTDAIQENASSADNIQSLKAAGVLNDLYDMHNSMMAELPPNDGHRKTILDPYHTHVGFGIALRERSLRLDELFLARYIRFERFVNSAKPKSSVAIEGRLLNPSHFLNQVDVYYEPFPTPPTIEWLRVPRSVSLPQERRILRPYLAAPIRYTDGSQGDFDWARDGKFRLKVKLFRAEPGIYTALFWVRRVPAEKGFPGGQVCIVSQ
ncbi:MAG TPA: CAP domain-containing protein [Pyrinomonadaceae bacterium]|nr:CAP domain-containing protein [Pyrinomonadaceae bacterium]